MSPTTSAADISSCNNISIQKGRKRGRSGEEEHDCRDNNSKRVAPRALPSEQVTRAEHSYNNTSVGDNAHAHFGDTHHVHYHIDPSQKNKYEVLYQSLYFERMNARLRNVAKALTNTCQWLFIHDKFVEWTDRTKAKEHNGLLWIKGKPGSGKSTIMKETLAWAQSMWSNEIIISYFFNARAPSDLEKSSLGLYRSLLHQLLSILPIVRHLFLSEFELKATGEKVEDWTETELQNFLVDMVTITPPILPSINVFIDALDEGQEDDVRRMVEFLELIGQRATSSRLQFRICLSSRHYPNITVNKAMYIIVEDEKEHSRDIERYIMANLRDVHSTPMKVLRKEVSTKSAGVFLWVVLIVQMLNKSYDRGERPSIMMNNLKNLPSGLHDLFADLIKPDDEEFDECITLLQWVMFSMRPLTPMELYLAIHQAHKSSKMEDAHSVGEANATRYILNCSRGLVEIDREAALFEVETNGEVKLNILKGSVQFIHETVRDYLVEAGILSPSKLNPYISRFISQTEICDMVIAKTCLGFVQWQLRLALRTGVSAFPWWTMRGVTGGSTYRGAMVRAVRV